MDLHDATLSVITIRWDLKQAELTLTAVLHGEQSIRVRGLRLLEAPRREPWGPSALILDIDEEHSAEGLQRVVLHMQSGDDITIEAEEIVMPK